MISGPPPKFHGTRDILRRRPRPARAPPGARPCRETNWVDQRTSAPRRTSSATSSASSRSCEQIPPSRNGIAASSASSGGASVGPSKKSSAPSSTSVPALALPTKPVVVSAAASSAAGRNAARSSSVVRRPGRTVFRMLELADGVVAYSLRERPELADAARQLGGVGPPFLAQDLAGQFASVTRFRSLWPDYSVMLVAGDEVVARVCSVPVCVDEDRPQLPRHGWDGALIWATTDLLDQKSPNTACAVDVQVSPAHRGHGVSGLAVRALRRLGRELGLGDVVVPVRPPDKAAEPFTPIDEYARRRRHSDGLPADRWLRVHVRAGGVIVGVAPFAMTVTGSLDDWRRWTDQEFTTSGRSPPRGASLRS